MNIIIRYNYRDYVWYFTELKNRFFQNIQNTNKMRNHGFLWLTETYMLDVEN